MRTIQSRDDSTFCRLFRMCGLCTRLCVVCMYRSYINDVQFVHDSNVAHGGVCSFGGHCDGHIFHVLTAKEIHGDGGRRRTTRRWFSSRSRRRCVQWFVEFDVSDVRVACQTTANSGQRSGRTRRHADGGRTHGAHTRTLCLSNTPLCAFK
jgi:hypothetical protein